MLSAIEAQRQERVALARTAFRFKIKALQTKSVAERTVHHSQYMQSVREIRDSSLERANHEWYQMHRSRRALEEPPVERILLTSYKRSDLVSQQNSYNTEVSILSGMAKYVGFPAAPEIRGISQSEMDEDLRMMGVRTLSADMFAKPNIDFACADFASASTVSCIIFNQSDPSPKSCRRETIHQKHAMGKCATSTTHPQPQRPSSLELHPIRHPSHTRNSVQHY